MNLNTIIENLGLNITSTFNSDDPYSELAIKVRGALQDAQDAVKEAQRVEERQRKQAIGTAFVGSQELVLEVLSKLADGEKINAIKVVREYTNLGLREAKNMVDVIDDVCIKDGRRLSAGSIF